STLWEVQMPALRTYMRKVSMSDQLAGRFNAHQTGCLLMISEEAAYSGDRGIANFIKDFVTSEEMLIEPENVDAYVARNLMRLLMITNDEKAIHVEEGARRFAVCRISDKLATLRKVDKGAHVAYFKAL